MLGVLKQQIKPEMSLEEKLNRVREFLQILILKIMHDKGYFNNLAFVGGTALRFLFNLRRFSEDLDFSLVDKKKYNFKELNLQIERELRLFGLSIETKIREKLMVQNTFLKFSELLKDLGVSRLSDQKLSIKIEVDSNPPKGWNLETTLINKVYLVNLVHFDLPSLCASKLHACLYRKYTKGRDFYDLVWYIARQVEPNYILLNNAIKQTQGIDLRLNDDNFKEFLLNNLEKIDFEVVKKDVERFLEDKQELGLLRFEIIKNMLYKK